MPLEPLLFRAEPSPGSAERLIERGVVEVYLPQERGRKVEAVFSKPLEWQPRQD